MSIVLKNTLRALATVLAIGILSPHPKAFAQAPAAPAPSSVLPTGGGATLLDPSDTVILLLDHQAGLFQTVKDIPVADLRSNVVMLAKLATLMKIPVITTASEPNGTNGPLMPEIHQYRATRCLCAAQGRSERLGQRRLRQSGTRHRPQDADHGGGLDQRLCDVPRAGCQGGRVQGVRRIDASGDPSEMASRTSLARFVQGGVPTTTNAVLSEIHRTWNRPEAAEIGELYALVSPNYAAVVESYQKAQEVAKQSR